MFRELRRKKQALSMEENKLVLHKGLSGVLAVFGENNYPYTVPLSYVYDGDKIFFHCAKVGHKLDAIKKNNKVSFCVIDQDQVVPQKYTTYFRSVILFGTVCILEEEAQKRTAFEKLAAKYSPHHEQGRLEEIDKTFKQVHIIELSIEHMTGKESIHLVKKFL